MENQQFVFVHEIVYVDHQGIKVCLSFPRGYLTEIFFKSFHEFFNSLVLPRNPEPVDVALCVANREPWIYGMMWVAKDYFKLWKPTDPPFCDPKVRCYKSFGDKLIATINLCCWVLDYSPELSEEKPIVFAGQVLLEQKDWAIAFSYFYQGQFGKVEVDKAAASELAALKEWKNPYNAEETPLLYNLIATAIKIVQPPEEHEAEQLIKRRQEFYEKAWSPYLKALQKWKVDAKNGIEVERQKFKFGVPWIKGDAIVAPSPKKGGKGFVKICESQKKNLSGRGRKKHSNIKITLAQQGLQHLESQF